MKNLMKLLGITLVVVMASCEGPAGPPGRDGFDGPRGPKGDDGVNILGQVMEIEGNFTPQNNYSILFDFPNSVTVFESDIVLVYLLWDQIPGGSGAPIDVWRLMPQTRILEQGLLQYNYDHTFLDVNIFLESDFNLNTLLPGDTQNQVFRIAVLPAEFAAGSKMDKSNLSSVMNTLNVTEKDIRRVKLD